MRKNLPFPVLLRDPPPLFVGRRSYRRRGTDAISCGLGPSRKSIASIVSCVFLLFMIGQMAIASTVTLDSSESQEDSPSARATWEEEFLSPPDAARPWVYWFIMDGNLTREGITADFEAMRDQGIGGFIMMEVDCGVPRGPVQFMSEPWKELFVHIVREAQRCGLQMTLPSGPGWAGSGGPWITPELSMLHLVATEQKVHGPMEFHEVLPTPQPRVPFFGEGALPPDQENARKNFVRDLCVVAFPTPQGNATLADIDEKAMYIRAPYSSAPGVKPRLESLAEYPEVPAAETVDPSLMVELTDQMDETGKLTWSVPEGDWTIQRFAVTSTGANTRPAPAAGMGLEGSKMDRIAFDVHAANYMDLLLKAVGERPNNGESGWCYFHLDSWEMGPQNYSPEFFAEFQKRRGYDPHPFLPAYTGYVVQSVERTERFLWDLRQTAQELILENHAEYLREIAHRNGLKLSLEFYDMMPCCDMAFGAVADVPMCEFWANTLDTTFCCTEAASIAHIHGKPIVAAEAFTSGGDQWRNYPGGMKSQTDWAFCTGINRITFHRYQHQPYLDRYPGFSMGHYGSHWERTQTWWPLSSGYHRYLTRCQYLLRKGVAVSDVLYLLPEGAPQVFTPPESAFLTKERLRDQRGYHFDGCDPKTLLQYAAVENHEIVFPNATRYRLLVLPNLKTMTFPLLKKIAELVHDGAMVIGPLPFRSPSLENAPQWDEQIRQLTAQITENKEVTDIDIPNEYQVVHYGQGKIYLPNAPTEPRTPLTLEEASWIWFPEGKPAWDAPAGSRFFRKKWTIPESSRIDSARIVGVADNDMTVFVNAQEVGRYHLGEPLRELSFTSLLRTGENILEIVATNGTSSSRNPAGMIAMVEVVRTDETGISIKDLYPTDETWETSMDNGVADPWKLALKLGDHGMSPWGTIPTNSSDSSELYPHTAVTSEILAQQGVVEDLQFHGDALRFIHRRDGNTDYYFVSNRLEVPYDEDIGIRATGKYWAILDPMTGRCYRTPELTQTDGVTKMRLALDGNASVFLVSRDEKPNSQWPIWKNLSFQTIQELNDDWTVTFDSRMGGPDKPVPFERLTDWSQHENPAIRYYSGIAEYKRSFTYEPKSSDERVFLDLGRTEVMAQIELNDQIVGILWTSPYRLEMTPLLKEGENHISIRVANLWPNRLIGDASLPESERTTWSTWPNGGYSPESPLYPSGLIGPVRLLRESSQEEATNGSVFR